MFSERPILKQDINKVAGKSVFQPILESSADERNYSEGIGGDLLRV